MTGAACVAHSLPEQVDCAVPSVVDPIWHGLQLATTPPKEKVPAAQGRQPDVPAYPGAHTAIHTTITAGDDTNRMVINAHTTR
jgi:hypothetical protein